MADLDLARIKRNVAKMASMNAPETDIDGYIASEGTTVEAIRAFRAPKMTADATGQRFDESGVPVGGVPMAEPEAPAQPQGEKFGGVAMNATAGVNEALYGVAGLPVDAMRGAMNLGVRGFNAATGADVPQIPENSFGGSRSIAETAGAVAPELDPQNTVAQTSNDRLARGVGQGVGGSVAPAGVVGGLQRAGVQVSPLVQALAGRSNSGAVVAADATAGAAAGGGSALAQELAPEKYKPAAALAGGIVGGGLGAVATGIPGLARVGAEAAGDFIAPLTERGREGLAASRLREAASDPRAAVEAIDNAPAPAVPGSQPTTFQQTGDMGLGALERDMQTRYPADFQQRRAEQNSARRDAIDAIQPAGAAEQVSRMLKERVDAIDAEMTANTNAARDWERGASRGLGQGQDPEVVGGQMRTRMQEARDAAKKREDELWGAVDPDGTLALQTDNARRFVQEKIRDLPKSARAPGGEEAAIYDVLRQYRDVSTFREVHALQSRVKTEMRRERMEAGETPAYARLAELNGALFRDLESAAVRKVEQQAQAVSRGELRPEDTIVARLENAPGTSNTVYTPSGRAVPIEYEVVDASTLRTSNGADGRPDPAYPAELQPRDRARAASDAQIATMARNLQPERLGASAEAGTGAPIVGPDGIVESGNGRVLAIRRAYGENGTSAKAYRDYLAGQGYDVAGMREPVLIRRRSGDMAMQDRARFAQEANASSSMSMSAGEQAATDASRLTPDVMRLYRGGDPASTENRDFARAFVGSVADRGQEGGIVTGTGTLSLDGAKRMRSAMLHAAYEDGRLVSALIEEGDENIKAFGRSLDDVAGGVARLKARVQSGEVDARADLAPPLVDAARLVQSARARGLSISDAVAQQDAFSPLSPAATMVLQAAYGPELTGRLSRERLSVLMNEVIKEAEQQTAGARLFGDALDIGAIIQGTQRRYGSAGQPSVSVGSDGPRMDAVRSGDGRPGSVPDGSERAGGGQEPLESTSADILPQTIEPNFSDAALGRLNAARDATNDRAGTFDNSTLKPMLRRPATNAPYQMRDASVPKNLFTAGAGSFEKIQTFRAAVNNDPAALGALEGFAIDSLRKAAIDRDTGAINPTKLEGWRRSHADALRAFPELDIKIGNAVDAGSAVERQAMAHKAALDNEQRGAFGRLIGTEDPQDVVRIVGGLFSRQDSAAQLAALRRRTGGDAAARDGLRKAVADHVTSKLVSNTEAATSGRELLKADQFQTFVKQNRNALRTVLTEPEVKVLEAVAADLQRGNRSLTAVKIPNQSNTAQDQNSVLRQIMAGGMENWLTVAGGGVGAAVGGAPGAVVGGGAAALFNALRLNGIGSVDELVRDAMLNPERARFLMAQVPKEPTQADAMLKALARRYVKAATAGAAAEPRTEEPKRGPMQLPPWVQPPQQGTPLQRALADR